MFRDAASNVTGVAAEAGCRTRAASSTAAVVDDIIMAKRRRQIPGDGGDDIVIGDGSRVTGIGTSNVEVADPGNDLAGGDERCSATGIDRIFGGLGDDRIDGGDDVDTL